MQQKNIHIVFGKVKQTLLESNEFDLRKSHLLSLDDNLSIGPVCDLYFNGSVHKRKEWLQVTLGDISYFDEILNALEQDLETLKTIIEHPEKFDKIFLWTGHVASEIISTARLLYHLSKLDKSIFIVNYPNIPVKSIHGDIIYPKSLVQTATFQVRDILKHFKLVDKNALLSWKTLWGKVISENKLLKVLDKGGRISKADVTYFDSFLESNCNENFQKAARVIAKTLIDIDFGVNDSYLNWRLKQLSLKGKIETQGSLSEIRDYEVKKITTYNSKIPGKSGFGA